MTGEPVRREIGELLSPTSKGPTPGYTWGEGKSAIGLLWTPGCEPMGTGNGSCIIGEVKTNVTAELSQEFGKWLFKDLPAKTTLQVTWKVSQKKKNDGTTDFSVVWFVQPKLKAGESTAGTLSYTKYFGASYRALNNPPRGSGLKSAAEVGAILATYGQFFVAGGAGDVTASGLPTPYQTMQLDGGGAAVDAGAVSAGVDVRRGEVLVDLNQSNPTNVAATSGRVGAPGVLPQEDALTENDVILVEGKVTGERSGKLTEAATRSLSGTPLNWLTSAGAAAAVELDDLELVAARSPDGQVQTAGIDMVVRLPLEVLLKHAPAGSQVAADAAALARTGAAATVGGGVKASPYALVRYSKRVNLKPGRTPDSAANLAAWERVWEARGVGAPDELAQLFDADGNTSVQLYVGGRAALSGNDKGGPAGGRAGAEVSEQLSGHDMVRAWHNSAPAQGAGFVEWDSCTNGRYDNPNRAAYGQRFGEHFSPQPWDVLGPGPATEGSAAPAVTDGGVVALAPGALAAAVLPGEGVLTRAARWALGPVVGIVTHPGLRSGLVSGPTVGPPLGLDLDERGRCKGDRSRPGDGDGNANQGGDGNGPGGTTAGATATGATATGGTATGGTVTTGGTATGGTTTTGVTGGDDGGETCPPGQVRDAGGTCGTPVEECLPGEVRGADGTCGPPVVEECPGGQVRDPVTSLCEVSGEGPVCGPVQTPQACAEAFVASAAGVVDRLYLGELEPGSSAPIFEYQARGGYDYWEGVLAPAAYAVFVAQVGVCEGFVRAFTDGRAGSPVTREGVAAALLAAWTACGFPPAAEAVSAAAQELVQLPSASSPSRSVEAFLLVWGAEAAPCSGVNGDCDQAELTERLQLVWAALANAVLYEDGVPVGSLESLAEGVMQEYLRFQQIESPSGHRHCYRKGDDPTLLCIPATPSPEAMAQAVQVVAVRYGLSEENAAGIAAQVRVSLTPQGGGGGGGGWVGGVPIPQ